MYRRGSTPWIQHVRNYQTEHNTTFADALALSRATYQPVSYGRIALSAQRAAAEADLATPPAPADGKSTDQTGAGIFTNLFAKITGGVSTAIKTRLEQRPLNIINVLKQHGTQPIVKIVVCKEPIKAAVRGLLNIASGGDLNKVVAEREYDAIFHLFMQLTLADGTVMRIEKNQRVAIALGVNAEIPAGAKTEDVKLAEPVTLQQFIDKGEKLGNSHGSFWRYNAVSDNCQKFVRDLLNASGITAQDGFIMQDAKALVKSGFLRGISRVATDLAAGADFLMKGGARDGNMKLFKAYKKAMIAEFGKGPMSDTQLSAKGKELFGRKFRGVYSQDTLPIGKRGMYIVNVDTRGEVGSHWVGVVETGDAIYVYDSFARHLSDLMPILEAKLNRKKIHVHEKLDHATQWGQTEICGQLATAYLCVVHELGIEAAMNF